MCMCTYMYMYVRMSRYHLQCLSPALPEVPLGDWYCPACHPIIMSQYQQEGEGEGEEEGEGLETGGTGEESGTNGESSEPESTCQWRTHSKPAYLQVHVRTCTCRYSIHSSTCTCLYIWMHSISMTKLLWYTASVSPSVYLKVIIVFEDIFLEICHYVTSVLPQEHK